VTGLGRVVAKSASIIPVPVPEAGRRELLAGSAQVWHEQRPDQQLHKSNNTKKTIPHK
jgi:hypothetical protein